MAVKLHPLCGDLHYIDAVGGWGVVRGRLIPPLHPTPYLLYNGGGGVQCTGIILIILADRCDMQGTARHGKLGLGGGYYPDRFLGWKDTDRV